MKKKNMYVIILSEMKNDFEDEYENGAWDEMAKSLAKGLLSEEELLDKSRDVPHIQLNTSIPFDGYSLDALFRGTDKSFHCLCSKNKKILQMDFEDISRETLLKMFNEIIKAF
jgi:hypothetical protein